MSKLDKLTKEELINFIEQQGLQDHPTLLKALSNTQDVNIPFQEFRDKYNYKKWDKVGTEKKWNKLTDEERSQAMEALDIYLKERKPDFIAMPQTWVNQKRWVAILEARDDRQKKRRQTLVKDNFDPLKYDLGESL